MRRTATLVTFLCVSLLALTSGGAAAPERSRVARSVYAAFSLVSQARPVTTRCGTYSVTRVTLEGAATSPEPRLAGRVTLATKIALNRGTGYGFATGTLTVRSSPRKVRLRGTLRGVVSESSVVNGLVSGKLVDSNEFLLANVSLIFNENYTFVAVRLGVESGQNSAVAYPVGSRCP